MAQGLLSDPNIDPEFLGMLVMVGVNRKKFKPLLKAIKELYFKKFRGHKEERDLTSATFVAQFFFLFLTLWRGEEYHWPVPYCGSGRVSPSLVPSPLETAIAGFRCEL